MNPQFFGNSKQRQLYGVYHKPQRVSDSPARAVVICSPLGQEYIRSHWACKLLAKQLARGGAHVLRFDYRGHGNSSGNIGDQQSLQSWTEDVGHAIDLIREKSNAASVMLVGLRKTCARCMLGWWTCGFLKSAHQAMPKKKRYLDLRCLGRF